MRALQAILVGALCCPLTGTACAPLVQDEAGEPAVAQVQLELNGQSALLNGMHDIESLSFMQNATAGTDKGWITDLRYIGTGGTPAADCHSAATSAGVSIIQRLDVSGSLSFPLNSTDAEGYANAFASYASQCPQIHVWIVGNEPNVTTNNQDPASYAAPYADAYVRVRNKVHALTGHQSDLILVAPASPYSPFCICSMHRLIQAIVARGGQPDGFAIHAYTQAQYSSDFGSLVGYITSEQMSANTDGCGYPFHWQFRIYQDWILAIEQENQGGKPVLITESGNACAPVAGNACYPNQNLGYFQAMYQEIRNYNSTHATKVQAITPYRWTSNDDGTGRDFAIGTRSLLQQDLTAAFAAGTPQSNNASVSINPPGFLMPGQIKRVAMPATNTGTTTWAGGGSSSMYRLASQSGNGFVFSAFPQCGGYYNSLSDARIYTCSSVAPGAAYTYRLDARAPTSGTSATLKVRMVQDGVEFFGNTPSSNVHLGQAYCGTAVTQCILDARTDILPFYQSNGWDTSCWNRDNIVNNWCGIDPTACNNLKSTTCAAFNNSCRCSGGTHLGGASIDPNGTFCGYKVCGQDRHIYECQAGWVYSSTTCN